MVSQHHPVASAKPAPSSCAHNTRRSADPDRRPQLHISGHGREPMATAEGRSGIRSISAVVACGRGHRRHVGGSRHRGRSTCRVADTRAVPVPRRRPAWAAVGGGDFKRWVRPPTQLPRPQLPQGPRQGWWGAQGLVCLLVGRPTRPHRAHHCHAQHRWQLGTKGGVWCRWVAPWWP